MTEIEFNTRYKMQYVLTLSNAVRVYMLCQLQRLGDFKRSSWCVANARDASWSLRPTLRLRLLLFSFRRALIFLSSFGNSGRAFNIANHGVFMCHHCEGYTIEGRVLTIHMARSCVRGLWQTLEVDVLVGLHGSGERALEHHFPPLSSFYGESRKHAA